MIEIIQIILFFLFFLIFTLLPLKINTQNTNKNINKKFHNFDKFAFNLIINLNILFLLSTLPININKYVLIFIFFYTFFFFYKYFFKNYKKNTIFNLIRLLYIPGLVFLCFSLIIANKLYLGWDAKYFYYVKSLFFFDGLSIKDLINFKDNIWHPPLGSFYWAFFWVLTPLKFEYFGRLFYLFIYCFTIFFLTKKIINKENISNIIFIIISLVLFKYERFSGLQEVLIFSLLILASYFVTYCETKNKIYILFLFLICNLIIWIKSEGIIYALIILLCIISKKSLSIKLRFISIFSFILIILFKYFIFYKYNFIYNAQPYNLSYIKSLDYNLLLHKIKYIFPYFFYYSFKNFIFLVGIAIIIYANFFKKNKSYLQSFNIFTIFNILFIIFAYLTREMEILFSIKTTMERILFQCSGFYLIILLIAVKEKFLNK